MDGENPPDLNRLLKESKTRVAVSERLSPIKGTVKRIGAIAESGGSDADGGMYEAKLFDCSGPNGNARVYPESVMKREVNRLKPMLKEGMFCGSIDHGTGLENQAIIFRDLRMDDQGAGYGTFEIVDTQRGQDLKKQIDAGMAVGFSTYGYGTGHAPSPDECKMYGIAEADAEDYVVMNDNYELAKADAVDDPAVPDARIMQPVGNGDSRTIPSFAEAVETPKGRISFREACDTGLHWIQRGVCGHVISQCKCEADDKYTVYAEGPCPKCAGAVEGMTVKQFQKAVAEKKVRRPVSESNDRQPLAPQFVQYIKNGDTFSPVGKLELQPELSRDSFQIVPTWDGVRFIRHVTKTDDLYHFKGSVTETVLKEIDAFWGMKEEYEKYGVMFHRGIIMEGPPGCGKSSCINQVVDMVTERGDVVFYGKNIFVLHEGLTAFRDVEPDRKVVVVLEDADEYVGYQERDLLNLLDGDNSIEGVLYLASTNYVERFPPRLLRPGRFDKRIHVGPPPMEGRRAYLEHKLGKVESAEEIDRLAKETDGLSFGHLRELITAVYALKENKADVLARLKASLPKRDRRTESAGPKAPTAEEKDISPATRLTQQQEATEGRPEPKKGTKIMAENAKLVEQINSLLALAPDLEGVKIPQREVLPAEFAELKSSLEKQLAEALATNAAQVETTKQLQAKIDGYEAEKANADRIAKATAKAESLLKDNAHAAVVREDVAEAVADKSFDESKVESFIKAKTAKYQKVAEAAKPAAGKLTADDLGTDVSDDQLREEDTLSESAQEMADFENPEPVQPTVGRIAALTEAMVGGKRKTK